jgi:phage terminase small subunit
MSLRSPRGLTPKQQAFVAEYLCDLNATQAAIRAGYSAKTADRIGPELLGKTCVREAIAEAKAARAERVEITADYVLRNLTEVVERCLQRAPVMTMVGGAAMQEIDKQGRHVWKFDAKGANGALNLLGQHLGLYTKKLEHSGEVKGGVLVVPGVAAAPDWSAAAVAQQEALEGRKRALAEAHGVD